MTTIRHDWRGGIAPAATRGGWLLPDGSSSNGGCPGNRRANACTPRNNEGQRANASLLPHCSIVMSFESVSGFNPDALPG
jgi:hypothetical protein